jgi:hypothetical protein
VTESPINEIIPTRLIAPLKRLGRKRWLDIVANRGERTEFRPVWDVIDDPQLVLEIVQRGQVDSILPIVTYAYSRLLSHGPKLVRPAQIHCEALRVVELPLRPDEYQQSFETILVEFPKMLRDTMSLEYGVECPKYCLLFRQSDPTVLFVATQPVGGAPEYLLFSNHNTIETQIQHWLSKERSAFQQQGLACMRVALNLALLLTRHNHTESPLDPESYKKNKRLLRSHSRRKRKRAKRYLDASVSLIRFAQEVTFFDRQDGITPQQLHTSGRRNKPHWRRGHWRRARVGEGRTETKFVFIKPILINAHLFEGDLADTNYTMAVPEQTRLPAVANTNVGTAI